MTGPFTAEALERLALAVHADMRATLGPTWTDWALAPHIGRLKATLHTLRSEDPGRLATAIIACYSDPATEDPSRLAYRGRACHWWKTPASNVGSKPEPFRASDQGPKAISSPEARERARQQLAQAIRPKEHAS